MTKAEWKLYYRIHRIVRREVAKATVDMLVFGTGCYITTPAPEYARYIPIDEVHLLSMHSDPTAEKMP